MEPKNLHLHLSVSASMGGDNRIKRISVEGSREMNLRDEVECEVGWKKRVSILVVDGGCLVMVVMGRKNMSLYRGHSVTQADSIWLLTAETRVQSRGQSMWVFLVGKEALGQI